MLAYLTELTSADPPIGRADQRDAERRERAALRTSGFDKVTDSQGDTDSRSASPDNDGGAIPRFQRWQLDFEARDIDSYARQLDHFAIELGLIELGLIGGEIDGIDYVSELSSRAIVRHGDSGAEKRLYFMWDRENPLIGFDRQLLQRAGAQMHKREILKFIPPTLENQLAKIELEYAMARGRSFKSIAKSVFFCESGGDRFQFVVREQRYRKQKD